MDRFGSDLSELADLLEVKDPSGSGVLPSGAFRELLRSNAGVALSNSDFEMLRCSLGGSKNSSSSSSSNNDNNDNNRFLVRHTRRRARRGPGQDRAEQGGIGQEGGT